MIYSISQSFEQYIASVPLVGLTRQRYSAVVRLSEKPSLPRTLTLLLHFPQQLQRSPQESKSHLELELGHVVNRFAPVTVSGIRRALAHSAALHEQGVDSGLSNVVIEPL